MNNSSDNIPYPQYEVHDPGPPRQQLRKQATPREATAVSNKIQEIKRSKKSLAANVLGVDNPQQTKLQGLNRTTTTVVDTTVKK